ncbi:type II toxin-antitoxin system ParD family antitoxin [Methylocystis sp. MJC1]|jgi:antitoxin ParD1/3/4|uniref:type II toxin-antitoxin system ParD family antitoxin n=1 Tax=Methylocystis sp. MJC1 TaxID=2654282 RepID=UPI0013EE2F04|nr:type II toxin-antitoxin system ParD family antitoxin [Methylocystis sp. MJC1]KAF2989578.1 hypothetical protein MJC1_03345 [Methylocystis sp. MJC1]MBU6528508.1 type II toxin-antitoxin system ParD family antitoxin [Methylocystis sp. MJC1]UZX11406.1 type II toxin-antitoxin system ParD family antitoxin [Methylocystis sp. MJC1]
MRTMTISLSDQQAQRIQLAVETGAYASNSEVLREALRLWEQREELRALELQRLKQAYENGLASGPGREVEADALLAEFKRKAGLGG